MATSFCRASERVSSKLATFAHAISNTNPTAPKQNQQDRFDLADDLFMQRDKLETGAGVRRLCSCSMRPAMTLNSRLRLFGSHARLEPADEISAVHEAARQL